jgi:hypothetical protein
VENPSARHLPSHALPIDPQELADAFTLIARVFSGEDNFDPTRYRMNVLNEKGEVDQVPFVDTPLNRIMLALQEWCREESVEKYLSLCWRLFALNELIHQGVLFEWVRIDDAPGFFSIPGAVLQVAAEYPLERGMGFDPHVFTEAVRKLVY